ncbi:MAG: hypothetical protein FWG22_06710 [Prolixibacteraceae bacterium]|nr:hypothetical protein [Prolixibacteraceae bacterium]
MADARGYCFMWRRFYMFLLCHHLLDGVQDANQCLPYHLAASLHVLNDLLFVSDKYGSTKKPPEVREANRYSSSLR